MHIILGTRFLLAVATICTPANQSFSLGSALPPDEHPAPIEPIVQSANDHLAWTYDRWLNQDAVHIISKEERAAFLALKTDEERMEFIEQFWYRRNPDPASEENLFQSEHYRRIAYANENFGTKDKFGWQTDRGHVYIVYGTPDSVDAHPVGSSDARTTEEGHGFADGYPFELWNYKYLEGVGANVQLAFLDSSSSGEYRLAPNDPPKHGLFETASFGSCPHCRNGLQRAPEVKFKDLSEWVTAHIVRTQIDFGQRFKFEAVTDCTVLTSITVNAGEILPVSPESKPLNNAAQFELFMRVSNSNGRVMSTIESHLPPSRSEVGGGSQSESLTFTKAVPLFSGSYRIDIVLRNVQTKLGAIHTVRLEVPRISLARR